MDAALKALILKIIKDHRIMTIATLRPDGWPQATTVGYASDGMNIYFLCGAESQKARNLDKCDRVSVTIDHDADNVMALQGLSMAATAVFVTEPAECKRLYKKLIAKYPGAENLPEPDPATVRYIRLIPKVISVLDYSKGFAHTDPVEAAPADLAAAA